MARTSGDVKSFSKRLSRSEMDEGRVYIDKSVATTFFGYPSNERRAVEVDLVLFSSSFGRKKIGLRKDGDKYYFNKGWSQFAKMDKLKVGDTISLTKIKPPSTEFMIGVTRN